jgi:3-methyladenine DNA glycosylase AlkD
MPKIKIDPYLFPLLEAFQQNANPQKAAEMEAYMLHQFPFFGIQAPTRKQIQKTFLREYSLHHLERLEQIVSNCFEQPQREFHYFAIELFATHKTLWIKDSALFIDYCIQQKSWWDTVDGMASDWFKVYFTLFPAQTKPVTARWNKSKNIWLQRSSIMFQKAYKQETNTDLLSAYILQHANSTEFFIQKAIGWALREFSKTNPTWVKQFVAKNKLAPLSKREALKRL